MRVASPPFIMGTVLPAWIWYGEIEWPFKLRMDFTWKKIKVKLWEIVWNYVKVCEITCVKLTKKRYQPTFWGKRFLFWCCIICLTINLYKLQCCQIETKSRTTDVQRGNSLHCTAKNSHPIPIFIRYGRSIFCLPHRPNFSDIFDLCLHWVSVVRGTHKA